MLLEERLLLQPRGCFPTVPCLVKHVRFGFNLNSCLSDELDVGPLGDFCSGGGCLCPGISSLEGSGAVSMLLSCCPGFVTVTCHVCCCPCSCHTLCPAAAASTGLQTP